MEKRKLSKDVEKVLCDNSTAVDTKGKSFKLMTEEVLKNLDVDLIEAAALWGDNVDEQIYDEIARQLREMGILEPLKELATESQKGY